MLNIALYLNAKADKEHQTGQIVNDSHKNNVKIVTYFDVQKLINDIEKIGAYFDVLVINNNMMEPNNSCQSMNLCLKVAAQIKEMNPDCRILFVSSISANETAIYEMNHICCVHKNELGKYIDEAVKKTPDAVEADKCTSLKICTHNDLFLLNQYDILYFERRGRDTFVICFSDNYVNLCEKVNKNNKDNKTYVRIIKANKDKDKCGSAKDTIEFTIQEKLQDIHDRLMKDMFIRCHESYVVNLRNITWYEKKKGFMINDALIPISRKYASEVHEKVSDFFN